MAEELTAAEIKGAPIIPDGTRNHLTADELLRVTALKHATELAISILATKPVNNVPNDITTAKAAKLFEKFLRGETDL